MSVVQNPTEAGYAFLLVPVITWYTITLRGDKFVRVNPQDSESFRRGERV